MTEPSADDADLREWFWRCALNLQNAAIKSVTQIAHPCDADHFADDAMRKIDAITEQRVAAAVQEERERCAGIADNEAEDYRAMYVLEGFREDLGRKDTATKIATLVRRKPSDRPDPEGAAPTADLARPRCSTPSQEDTGPVSGPMVERVAAALDATPNLFLRVNKGRADGYPHEICWPGEPIVVIAAYRDRPEAVSRRGQLQLRAYASAAIAVMSSPPTDAGDPGSASNSDAAQERHLTPGEQFVMKRALRNSTVESSPTQTVAPPGPTAGDVGRALPWETLEADELREISDVERGERGADFVCVTRSAISDALTARGSVARAELLAQIREPTKAVVECVATKLERTFARSAYDKSIVVLRALADKLTEPNNAKS